MNKRKKSQVIVQTGWTLDGEKIRFAFIVATKVIYYQRGFQGFRIECFKSENLITIITETMGQGVSNKDRRGSPD